MQLTISPDFVSSGGVVCKRNTKKFIVPRSARTMFKPKLDFHAFMQTFISQGEVFPAKHKWGSVIFIRLRISETHFSNLLGWRNYAQTSWKTGGHQKMSLYFTHLFCNMRYFWLCQPGVNKEKLCDLFYIS